MTPDSSLVGEVARDAQAAMARLRLTARATKAIRNALAHLGTIKVVGPEGIELSVDLRAADEGTIARTKERPDHACRGGPAADTEAHRGGALVCRAALQLPGHQQPVGRRRHGRAGRARASTARGVRARSD